MTAGAPAPPVVVGVDGTATTPLAVAWAADYCGTSVTPLRLVAAYREDPFEAELRAAGAPENSTDSYQLNDAQRDLEEAAAYARSLDPTLPIETVAVPGPAASVLLTEAQRSAMVVVGRVGWDGCTGSSPLLPAQPQLRRPAAPCWSCGREPATHCKGPASSSA